MNKTVEQIVDLKKNPITNPDFRVECKKTLDTHGALVLKSFLLDSVITEICHDGEQQKHLAYYTERSHNIYLSSNDPDFSQEHPRNRQISSSKGCITTDQIPDGCSLKILYKSTEFKEFLCEVLDEEALYEYADELSSINLHYASEGQELGWHFDNSSFAITLLLQKPEAGGEFQYVKDVRDADAGEMNYVESEKVLDGKTAVQKLAMSPGDLVLFRGRNSMHRVTSTIGDQTRMLVVLAYNSGPGIELSESARMTFYGRI